VILLKVSYVIVQVAPARPQIRSGIGGIQKAIEQKAKITDTEISKAFKDLDKLIEQAKPMVTFRNLVTYDEVCYTSFS
jgi:hypothetical protein